MDDGKKIRYRNLINGLYSIISSIKNQKSEMANLENITISGIKINEENPEKEIVSNAINSLDNTTNRLYSAISSMRRSMNKIQDSTEEK